MIEPITSYAQNFEDVILWRALGHVADGLYIDIGAQSPVVDSVSMGFSEKGWQGVHVDANPAYAAELREARPDDTVLEALVSSRRGVSVFHAIEGTGLSTVDPDIARAHLEDGRFAERVVPVPAVTLDDVFDLVPDREVHWLKIDVEGAEAEVLEGWQSKRRPWVVVVESVHPVTRADTFESWQHHLIERGYGFVYADGLNRFYLHDDHADLEPKFAVPPNVFDLFRLSGTATSSFTQLIRERGQSEASRLGALKDEAVAGREVAEKLLSDARAHMEAESRCRESLEEELRKKDQGIGELSERLEHSEQRNAQLSTSLTASTQEVARLSASLSSSTQEVAQLSASLTSSTQEIAQLSASLALSAQELGQLREQVAAGVLERQRLEADVLERRTLTTQLASQVSSMLQISLQATSEARSATAERDRLADQLLETGRKLSDAVSLERRNHVQQSEMTRLSDELERALSREAFLTRQLADIRISHSWRLTSPLRVLSSLLRGNLGYAKASIADGIAQLDPHGLTRRVIRRLLPAGSRLGAISRRKLYGVPADAPAGAPVSPSSSAMGIGTRRASGDYRRLLELTGVVGSMRENAQ